MNDLALPLSRDGLRPRILAALVVVYLVWSSTYLAVRHMVAELPPLLVGGCRFILASALLFTVQRLRGAPMPAPGSWPRAAAAGVLLFTLGNGLVCLAETRTSSSVAAVACASTPLFVALFGALRGERPSRREALAIAAGLAGVAVLFAGRDLRVAGARGALLFLAPVAWAGGTVLARGARAASPTTFAAQQMLCGGMVMAASGWLLGERLPAHVSNEALGAVGWLVVMGSVVAFPAYAFLVQNARPAVATSYAYVNPALAVLLGAALGGESLGASTLGSLALVVAAVALATTGGARR